MFGGRKFSRNSELLRDADSNNSNAGSSISSVNDSLFMKVNDAENHAKQIIKTGQSQYVDGIKQNVLDMVRLWLQEEGDNIFTLYGKMGCGKSFFSARLYADIGAEKEIYDTVAFSSQQIYRDTANVRNMLLSLAHQLFMTVPACSDFFARHPLDGESIPSLTEDVLINAFEGKQLRKTVFIIIDGLDEYPRQDCEAFLETLGRLRVRLNPKVKIFFSSRPESYIMSEMTQNSENSTYHIEKNEVHSHADCARFIDVKCRKAGIEIDENMRRALIEKSECSLKYLECFFNDIACGAIRVTADFIDSLPMGLSHYYRDQLVRYFGDESLRFYQNKIVPLLELLCVAWRPITIEDASDILGCRESEINTIISRSGTLLWRNNRYVMLYQSESIREFLMDERYCPEKYRIDSENGNERILQRLEEMMDNQEEIESNMYLFNCAVDHIIEKDRVTNADWNLLVRLIDHYAHKSDVVFKISRGVLEKTPREIMAFLRCLYTNRQIEPLLKDCTCVRLIAAATRDKQDQKLQAVLDLVEGQEEYDFLVSYGRIRMLRNNSQYEEALKPLLSYLTPAEDEPISLFRHTHYLDEAGRIYRNLSLITWEENTDLHIQALNESEQLLKKFPNRNTPVHLYLVNNLAVSYDQIGRLSEQLEKKKDSTLRQNCGQKLLPVLNLPESDPKQPGFFLVTAEAAYQKQLKLSKISQQYDPFSDGRIHGLHYPFYALGILYFRKDFPGYNPEKALQYFEDCLSSIREIALRPESHVRFIDVPVKMYGRLCDIYTESGEYALARKYLAEARQMRDLRLLYHPSADSDFGQCYGYEMEADIVLAEQGIEAAESYFLTALQHYQACCQKYNDRFVQRSLQVVYYRLAKNFKEAGNLEKFIHYSRLELKEIEKVYGMYPSRALRWDWAVTMEQLANALRQVDPEGTIAQRIELQEGAIAIYNELTKAYPQEQKYYSAPCTVYFYLAMDYRDTDRLQDALQCMDHSFRLCRHLATDYPDYNYLLDIPVRLFLVLYKHITDPETLQKYYEESESYVSFAAPYTDDEDFLQMRCYFQEYQAERIQEEKGIEAAEEAYLAYIESAKVYAKAHPSEQACMSVVTGYTDLYLGYSSLKNTSKSIAYLQEALVILDQAINYLPKSMRLRKLRGMLYGTLADILQKFSDVKQLSTAADLYILQIQQYLVLHKDAATDAEKEEYRQRVTRVLKVFDNFLQRQETVVRTAQAYIDKAKDRIREYVKVLVTGYTFLSRMRIEGAAEKMAKYSELLKQLED